MKPDEKKERSKKMRSRGFLKQNRYLSIGGIAIANDVLRTRISKKKKAR